MRDLSCCSIEETFKRSFIDFVEVQALEEFVVKWLNYHHLYYFRTIATEGTIAQAAERLRLGQPSLSMQLKQFEEQIGYRLFERKKKRLHLTESGRVALEYANEIFRLGDEMLEALDDRRDGDRIDVALGVMDTVPKHLVLRLVEQAQAITACALSISEGHGDELLRELKAHRIDLLLSNYAPPVGHGGGIFARTVAKMPVVICGTRKFSHLRRDFPRSLDGESLVMPTTHSRLRQDVDHFLKLQQIRVNVPVEVQDSSLLKILAVHGAGLIPIAKPAVEDLLEAKELIEIGVLPGVYEELWLAAGERRIENPVAAGLMKKFRL